MIQCPQCGAQLPDTLKFCTECGTSIESAVSSQAPQVEGFMITKPMVIGAIGAIGMVMIAIGSALPWATASAMMFTVSKGGLSGDGVFTLVLAILGLVFFSIAITGRANWSFVVGLIISLLVLAITIYDTVNVARIASNVSESVSADVGIGLIVCIIGGAIGALCGTGGFLTPKRPS